MSTNKVFSAIKKLPKGAEASTVKTVDILRMINDVNNLQEQQEIIKNSKLCDLLSVQNAVKSNIEYEAFDIVQSMLREEGIEFDQE